MSTDPSTVLELVEMYAAARVQEERLYREVVIGSSASIDPHLATMHERRRLLEKLTETVTRMSRD